MAIFNCYVSSPEGNWVLSNFIQCIGHFPNCTSKRTPRNNEWFNRDGVVWFCSVLGVQLCVVCPAPNKMFADGYIMCKYIYIYYTHYHMYYIYISSLDTRLTSWPALEHKAQFLFDGRCLLPWDPFPWFVIAPIYYVSNLAYSGVGKCPILGILDITL